MLTKEHRLYSTKRIAEDTFFVLCLILLLLLFNSSISMFNPALLLPLASYFCLRFFIANDYPHTPMSEIIFSFVMAIIFLFTTSLVLVERHPLVLASTVHKVPQPAHITSMEELWQNLKNSDHLHNCPSLAQTLTQPVDDLSDRLVITRSGFLVVHVDGTWSRHILNTTPENHKLFSLECHTDILRPNPRAGSLFDNFSGLYVAAYSGFWVLSWDTKDQRPVWLNRAASAYSNHVHSIAALSAEKVHIATHTQEEANLRFGITLRSKAISKKLLSLNESLRHSYIFWDIEGAPYVLSFASLPQQPELIPQSSLFMLREQLERNPWHPVVYLNPRTLEYYTPREHAGFFSYDEPVQSSTHSMPRDYRIAHIRYDPLTHQYYMVLQPEAAEKGTQEDLWARVPASLNEHLHLTREGDNVRMVVENNKVSFFQHGRWGRSQD